MLWSRIWPVRRGRPIAIEVPAIDSAKNVAPAKAAITDAVLAGDITANEARPILKVIDSQRDQLGDDLWCELAGDVGRLLAGDE